MHGVEEQNNESSAVVNLRRIRAWLATLAVGFSCGSVDKSPKSEGAVEEQRPVLSSPSRLSDMPVEEPPQPRDAGAAEAPSMPRGEGYDRCFEENDLMACHRLMSKWETTGRDASAARSVVAKLTQLCSREPDSCACADISIQSAGIDKFAAMEIAISLLGEGVRRVIPFKDDGAPQRIAVEYVQGEAESHTGLEPRFLGLLEQTDKGCVRMNEPLMIDSSICEPPTSGLVYGISSNCVLEGEGRLSKRKRPEQGTFEISEVSELYAVFDPRSAALLENELFQGDKIVVRYVISAAVHTRITTPENGWQRKHPACAEAYYAEALETGGLQIDLVSEDGTSLYRRDYGYRSCMRNNGRWSRKVCRTPIRLSMRPQPRSSS